MLKCMTTSLQIHHHTVKSRPVKSLGKTMHTKRPVDNNDENALNNLFCPSSHRRDRTCSLTHD